MSYKVDILENEQSGWTSNALRFETQKEAESYGSDLFSRWFGIALYRVVQSTEPANYVWRNERLLALEKKD